METDNIKNVIYDFMQTENFEIKMNMRKTISLKNKKWNI